MPKDVAEPRSLPVSEEEARAELEIVLRSATLDRSERLQKLLRFICELTLKGEASRIHEYLIGSEVFHKGADYNPNEDSIVRRQAHALRKKLQDYYASEGRDRLIRIELPVGRYVPNFRRSDRVIEPLDPPPPAVELPAMPALPAVPDPPVGILRRYSSIWIGVVLFALGIASGIIWKSAASVPGSSLRLGPAATAVWSAWLKSPTGAVVCMSNPDAAVVKRLDRPPVEGYHPTRFPIHPSDESIYRDMLQLPAGGKLYFTPASNMAKMGEAVAGVFLGQFMALAGQSIKVTQSRILDWEELRHQNLILLGNNESNQWIDPLLTKYPLRLGYTAGSEPRSILNSQPGPGEPEVYRIAYSGKPGEADEEFALVSMITGLESNHQLLLIAGLNMQATQIATEYLTSEETLKELVSRLRALQPNHSGPWHFQAVLKTQVYNKVPTRAALVTLRVLD